MKFLAFFLCTLAFAPAVRAEFFGWYCEAEGYDQFQQRFVVQSSKELVQWEAERSALAKCADEGYTACRVQRCWDAD